MNTFLTVSGGSHKRLKKEAKNRKHKRKQKIPGEKHNCLKHTTSQNQVVGGHEAPHSAPKKRPHVSTNTLARANWFLGMPEAGAMFTALRKPRGSYKVADEKAPASQSPLKPQMGVAQN